MTGEDDVQRIAKAVAQETVREMFEMLAVDVSSPGARGELRRDMMFVRDLRTGARAIRSRFLLSLVGIGTAILVYLTLGLKVWR